MKLLYAAAAAAAALTRMVYSRSEFRNQKNKRCTCGGRPQDHWLGSGNAQVPDPVPVAHVLLEQLAQGSRSCGGFKAGHNLSREEGEMSMRGLKRTHCCLK